jgi:orotidine-5'-phosphate decarboxylase
LKAELCVALDFQSREEAASWIQRLSQFPVVLKFGLRMLPLLPPEFFKDLKKAKSKIFIDAKLHDIPSQVEDSVKIWSGIGADYLTIHLSGGRPMIEGALKTRQRTEILGVSVLTSMSQKDFKVEGDSRSISEIVSARVEVAYATGLRYVVCSVSEVEILLKKFPDLKCVTPGLYADPAEIAGDQARVAHYEEALNAGAKMLVMGRSILKSKTPEVLVESILKRIG